MLVEKYSGKTIIRSARLLALKENIISSFSMASLRRVVSHADEEKFDGHANGRLCKGV